MGAQELIDIQQARIAEQQDTTNLIRAAKQTIEKLTRDLTTATQVISDKNDLIKQLSEDNLKLVAKLDQLTGKKAPSNTFGA